MDEKISKVLIDVAKFVSEHHDITFFSFDTAFLNRTEIRIIFGTANRRCSHSIYYGELDSIIGLDNFVKFICNGTYRKLMEEEKND